MTDGTKSRANTPTSAIADFDPQFTPKHKAGSVESFAKISVGGKSKDASLLNVSASKDVLYSDKSERKQSKCQAYSTVIILLSINLLNYMDRYTIAAVLLPIQQYFEIGDGFGGLLQTVFICAYMIFAPVFGYLGDRYSRKLIMIAGIFIWSSTVLLSSFVGREHFYLFVLTRAVVGIGEASYSTVSPTIIADLFTKDQRSLMLMLFYFAIPVGSGLGYVLGGAVASFTDCWQWGVRVTPVFGAICLFLLIFVVQEPRRESCGAKDAEAAQANHFLQDLLYLSKNNSFLWSTFGFTCVAFVSGAIALWTPNFIIYGQQALGFETKGLTLIFGVVTCLSGFVGVTIGSMWATHWRKTNGQADALVCAIGLLICLPFYFIVVNYGHLFSRLVLFILIFFAITGLSLNWAVCSDILMYVVVPACRSTANAAQMLIGHLLGDAFSPYLVGLVSDAVRGNASSVFAQFQGLKYALYIPSFVLVLGSAFFFVTSLFIVEDKKNAQSVSITADMKMTSKS